MHSISCISFLKQIKSIIVYTHTNYRIDNDNILNVIYLLYRQNNRRLGLAEEIDKNHYIII